MDAIEKSLAFNPQYFLAQVVLFILLWAVLSRLFFKPYMAHLVGRDKKIADAYVAVQNMQQEMETLRADYMARITLVEAEARAHIQTAIKEAQDERERLISEARAAAESHLTDGTAALDHERTESLTALTERMSGLASGAAHTALGQNVDMATLRASVEQSMASARN